MILHKRGFTSHMYISEMNQSLQFAYIYLILNMCNTELLHHGDVLLLQRSGVDDTTE